MDATQHKKPYGDRIRRARIRAGLSQTELAASIGTSAAYVSQWETGHREPMLSRAADIACALGVSLGFIAGLEDQP